MSSLRNVVKTYCIARSTARANSVQQAKIQAQDYRLRVAHQLQRLHEVDISSAEKAALDKINERLERNLKIMTQPSRYASPQTLAKRYPEWRAQILNTVASLCNQVDDILEAHNALTGFSLYMQSRRERGSRARAR